MAERKTIKVSFCVSPEKARKLDALSVSTNRSQSSLLEQALDDYLELQAWQISHIEEGLADADAGRVTSHERVRAWLRTWENEIERDPTK